MVHHEYSPKRREDMSKLLAFARFIERFQGLAVLAGAVLIALGFRVKTPGQKLAEEDRRITVLELQQDSLKTQHREMLYYMHVIAVATCIKQESIAPCQELLRESPRFSR